MVTEVGNGLAERTRRSMRATVIGVGISAALGAVKLLSGIIGHSYALIADGIESFLDIFSSMVVWGGLRIAARPPDENHPYGHGKAESMAALVVALALLTAATGLAIQSIREISQPHHAPAPFTLAVLLVVVAVKEVLHARIGRIGRATQSTALHADAWHHRSDALTSAAAFIGISVALVGGEGYESADDWAALLACSVIAYNGLRIVRTAASEVMDVAAPRELEAEIRAEAQKVEGVAGLDKCIARKSGPAWLVDLHVIVDGTMTVTESHAIGHAVKDRLILSPLGILDVLVHIEPAETDDDGEATAIDPEQSRGSLGAPARAKTTE